MRTHSHSDALAGLGRREREIMLLLFELGEAPAAEIHRRLPDPPTYSSVRKMLAYLESKGRVRHRRDGVRFLYQPVMAQDTARRSALRSVLRTFFGGSAEALVTALVKDGALPPARLRRLEREIARARTEADD